MYLFERTRTTLLPIRVRAKTLLDVIANVSGDVFRLSPTFENANEGFIRETRHSPTYLHTVRFFVDRRFQQMNSDIHQFEVQFDAYPEKGHSITTGSSKRNEFNRALQTHSQDIELLSALSLCLLRDFGWIVVVILKDDICRVERVGMHLLAEAG